MLPISPTSSRLTTSSSSPNRASSCSAPDPENRGGPCRTRRCTPPTGPLPAKTGQVSVEGTSGESGPGPDDFGPVLGYYEAGPTQREAGPGGLGPPSARRGPGPNTCGPLLGAPGPGPGASGPGRNQLEAGRPASVRRNEARKRGAAVRPTGEERSQYRGRPISRNDVDEVRGG